MSKVLVKLPDSSAVLASIAALRRRVVASSPLSIILQQELERTSSANRRKRRKTSSYPELDILNELPSHLLTGTSSAHTLRILFEILGSDLGDSQVFEPLDRTLDVTTALHMHAFADWMLAATVTQHLATWFCKKWLRSPELILAGLSLAPVGVLQSAARSRLFASSSISEDLLAETINSKLMQAQADIEAMQAKISQQKSFILALENLKSVLVAEDVVMRHPPAECVFPVFVRFESRSFVLGDCTAATDAQELRARMQDLLGVPEALQRFEFGGKPLPNVGAIVSFGVRRDSTLNLALRMSCRRVCTVLVQYPGSDLRPVLVHHTDTVADILAHLEPRRGILVYAGRVLQEDDPLARILNLCYSPILHFVSR